MGPIDQILPLLTKVRRRQPGQWSACCPAHVDKGPSLSLRETPDGAVLLHCFAGCAVEDVVGTLGLELRDLFPPKDRRPDAPGRIAKLLTPGQALDLLHDEAQLVAICAANIGHGTALTGADRVRLLQAAGCRTHCLPPQGGDAMTTGMKALDALIEAAGGSAAMVEQILPLKALDAHELALMQFKTRETILAPWLHSQDLCMVFAARGIGKTHFGLSIAYAVATGGTFAKWSAPTPRRVLYLDGELPGSVMQKRLLMHCPDVEPEPGYLRIFTPELLPEGRALPDLATYEGQAAVDDMIEDADVVIVDNLSCWVRAGRENEAESWAPVADWMLSLRRRGIAVVLVHHAGKGGQQRGTSKREDQLDVVIGLSRPTDYDASQGAVFVAEFTKARNLTGADAESLEFKLSGDDDCAVWTWRTVESSTFDRVVALAKEGLKPAEICLELEINKSSVSRHLRKARELGDLPREAKP